MLREISYSEGQTLLSCQAKWDFKYGDRLAGASLKEKVTPPLLRDGKAWGAAMAAYHSMSEIVDSTGGDPAFFTDPSAEIGPLDAGVIALVEAFEADAEQAREAGLYDPEAHRQAVDQLRAILEHYHLEEQDAPPPSLIPLEDPELKFLVPLPSRTGVRDSNRYRLDVRFDGTVRDAEGRLWLVEFKLRTRLSPLQYITESRQIRYYAWAYRKETSEEVTGVIVDERLKAAPKEPRLVKARGKGEGVVPSHAKDQMCTVEDYLAICEEYGVEPKEETVESLRGRRWHQRHPVFLREDEIDEAGDELVSLGQQVQALDSHSIFPVRNKIQSNCNGCFYKEICNNPADVALVDSLFDRRPPKRDRVDEEITV